MSKRIAIGVDIGGSGIKAAPVDLERGRFTKDRFRVPTPQPATPDAVGAAVAEVVGAFKRKRSTAIGVTFPGVVQQGIVRFAPNVDQSWIGVNVNEVLEAHVGHEVVTLNDADAAGYGEYLYGAAHGRKGVIYLCTLGTGIGSAFIVDGEVVPNTEFGHLMVNGHDAEEFAAESARERHGLSWEEWAVHLQAYFSEVERLLWPDLIIVGGGVSKEHDQFLPLLTLRTPIIPAELLNDAGIVGAAASAHHAVERAKAAAKKERKAAAAKAAGAFERTAEVIRHPREGRSKP